MSQAELDFISKNFGGIVAVVLILVIGVIGVTFSIRFDLNKFLESRKKTNLHKAQHFCPHMEFEPAGNNQIKIISWFESPPGTTAWICSACGFVVSHIDESKEQKDAEYWIKNIKLYHKQIKKHNKYAKKST